ncbi:uncharacterized protein F4822DRAFT_82222 [Hypoxylon trugodes]|uniref:uncharacterized protein n=1 Tax=Hypoxylon trugodes TaxID=326681 RepID=UPI00218DB5AE|nr:uncharacterized protein F4822DRAFT_82222 [Hypoxylon trugodes]KAI1383593.1 hypothetical protein F4822DRAFT_82222 [Hypoxylon trugodes]
MSDSTQYYRVYKLKSKVSVPDPDIVGERFHHSIFVESNADGSGMKFHVTGDITAGMKYEIQERFNPDGADMEHTKEPLGFTDRGTFPKQWDEILSQQAPPPKQKAFNIKTLKTEPVKTWEPLTFYAPGEQREPLWKCTEWTEYQALPALYDAGLIVQLSAHTSGS